MSPYRSFALIGAGQIGIPIAQALLNLGASVVIITRSSPEVKPRTIPEASYAMSDYTDSLAITKILREHHVEVVISTVGGPALSQQNLLADAAKDAGVQLFVPSEFGIPTEGHKLGHLAEKAQCADYLRSIGLPYARFYVGMFLDMVPWLVGIRDTGKFIIVGKGNVPVTFTAISDIAGFTAHVLTSLPPTQLSNATFRIEGYRSTLNDLAALFDADLHVPVLHVDAFPGDELRTLLQNVLFESGNGSTGWGVVEGRDMGTAGSANSLWAGHQWKGVKEVHGLGLGP